MAAESIFLYGPSGVGKSTLGPRLAELFHLPFYDLDEWISRNAQRSIAELFETSGEAGFREIERQSLIDLVACGNSVIALGGGALLNESSRALVEKSGKILCLSASYDILLNRIQRDDEIRPLLDGENPSARLRAMLDQRKQHYQSFPLSLDTSLKTIEEIAWQAQLMLKCFRVAGMGQEYTVRVEPDGFLQFANWLSSHQPQGNIAVVSDRQVAGIYLEPFLASLSKVGFHAAPVVISGGEIGKNIGTVNHLWNSFLENDLDRGSLVIALGGGIVGDIAGFAAASYLRGIDWINLPTSVLAMVDASMGGKTGIDLPQGKNLVGAFHAPRLVVVDPNFLATLSEEEWRNGFGEVVKHGIIGDPMLFEECRQGWRHIYSNIDEIIARAIAVKVKILLEDPYEHGKRAALNLGHTFGHALETLTKYTLRHGEAVAIGMVIAARISERLGMAGKGLSQEISEVLTTLNLPIKIPTGVDLSELISAMSVDKKRKGGKVKYVLPQRIGQVAWGVEIPDIHGYLSA